MTSKGKSKKTVFIVYESVYCTAEKGMRKAFVDVFSTRKKASAYVKGKRCLVAECEVK